MMKDHHYFICQKLNDYNNIGNTTHGRQPEKLVLIELVAHCILMIEALLIHTNKEQGRHLVEKRA